MTIEEMKASIIESLTVELENDPDFSDDILEEKVTNAVEEVKRARRYKSAGYSDEQIEADIIDFQSNIRDISLYDYNQIGVDFQSSDTENGKTRSFINRRQLFNGIIPLAKLL